MEVGREVEKSLKRMAEALERNAVASEELISLAKEERDVDAKVLTPGFCPHCAAVNPTVRSEGGVGEIDDFVLQAACNRCGHVFFAIPNGWTVCVTADEARDVLRERGELVRDS
jgi:hypothetical protein